MWSAATSTTTPSGSFRPSLTIIFKSEPSGFAENMRPPPRSRKNRRPAVRLIPDCAFILQLQQLLLPNALWMQKVDDQYIRPRDRGKAGLGLAVSATVQVHLDLQTVIC